MIQVPRCGRMRGNMNSRLNLANLKKTYYYLKKNGVRAAVSAVKERMSGGQFNNYSYESPSEKELDRQRQYLFNNSITFSILVPAYNTAREYLLALLQSVQAQTYPHWELLIADASTNEQVKEVVSDFIKENGEKRIRYIRLSENQGISGNSNQGLEHATGEYTALLDHDDLLTPDALFENALQIEKASEKGVQAQILYSDEDKCNQTGENYYEVYHKQDFNFDLLLSNNYICHFLVMRTELMQKLKFRCNFDGSQDYDLILRGVADVLPHEEQIVHIPKVLYHWRCHDGSTAANPQSKQYAYEAGKRTLEDFLQQRGWAASVAHTKHLGFFEISYEKELFWVREDVGIIGGRILDRKGRVAGGIYDKNGVCPYQGLPKDFSGYMHQASLAQDAEYVDLRFLRVRKELWDVFEKITGVPYLENPETKAFDASKLPANTDIQKVSQHLCRVLKERGYRTLWQPAWTIKMNEEFTNENNGCNS